MSTQTSGGKDKLQERTWKKAPGTRQHGEWGCFCTIKTRCSRVMRIKWEENMARPHFQQGSVGNWCVMVTCTTIVCIMQFSKYPQTIKTLLLLSIFRSERTSKRQDAIWLVGARLNTDIISAVTRGVTWFDLQLQKLFNELLMTPLISQRAESC